MFKKKVIAVMLCTCMLFSLSACGNVASESLAVSSMTLEKKSSSVIAETEDSFHSQSIIYDEEDPQTMTNEGVIEEPIVSDLNQVTE